MGKIKCKHVVFQNLLQIHLLNPVLFQCLEDCLGITRYCRVPMISLSYSVDNVFSSFSNFYSKETCQLVSQKTSFQ